MSTYDDLPEKNKRVLGIERIVSLHSMLRKGPSILYEQEINSILVRYNLPNIEVVISERNERLETLAKEHRERVERENATSEKLAGACEQGMTKEKAFFTLFFPPFHDIGAN